jgi:hypothetical protein
MLRAAVQRRAVRRAVRTSCQVVDASEFRLLGQRVLDLSPRGMLVACDRETQLGDDIIISFRAPGREELWFDAEAVVARILSGNRWGDSGYCAGLDFTYFERPARHELLARLAGLPPPVPRRRLRSARDRVSHPSWNESVLVRPIMSVGSPPAAPTRHYSVPRGVFA